MLINPNINPRYYYSTITPTLIRKMRGNRAKLDFFSKQKPNTRSTKLDPLSATARWIDAYIRRNTSIQVGALLSTLIQRGNEY